MQITENFVNQVSAPQPEPGGKGNQTFYRDSDLVGFGLRVASGGTKSWILERRIRGKVKRITLGRCDEISLEKAKAKATKLIKEIERENAPRIINPKHVKADITLEQAFYDYMRTHQELSQLTVDDYQRSMHGPLKDWQSLAVREISEKIVLDKHRAFAENNKARCNNAMRLLRAILNHVRLHLTDEQHKPIIVTNPVDVLSQQDLWHTLKRKNSQNIIKQEQLEKWWQATQQLRTQTTRDYLCFLLLSGLSHGMAARLRYEDIDYGHKRVRLTALPGNTSTVYFPLNDYLMKVITESAHYCMDKTGFLFPGLNKETYITDPRSAIKHIQSLSGIKFSLTDLHRSFVYLAEHSGMTPSDIKLIEGLSKGKQQAFTADEYQTVIDMQNAVFKQLAGYINPDNSGT